ncbi:hypothetical protein ABZP36_018899 [Zizania latifolia]
MILVDGVGGEWPVIGHAPWNGCNLADFVMTFFLFIVGMAIPLSLKGSTCKLIIQLDRIYLGTPSKIAIIDHEKKRTFVVRKGGLPDAGIVNAGLSLLTTMVLKNASLR